MKKTNEFGVIICCLVFAIGCAGTQSLYEQVDSTENVEFLTRVALDRTKPVDVRKRSFERLNKPELLIGAILDARESDHTRGVFFTVLDREGKIHVSVKLLGIWNTPDPLLNRALQTIPSPHLIATKLAAVEGRAHKKRILQMVSLETLAVISESCPDKAAQMAARVMLGTGDWDNFVDNKSNWGLGNILGAIALVSDNKAPMGTVVRHLCHKFIKQGDESRIPELKQFLTKYGDISLAEDYMNAGHQELFEAGASWGRAHGYDVGDGYGSHRVRWGSER